MAEKDINLKPVLKRYPPGDQWVPTGQTTPIFESLTDALEWVFVQTKEKNYVIKAGKGIVYIYHEQEIPEPEPEPVRTYNLYGE